MDSVLLPLPIAALVRRVRSGKSAKERHDLAYFAWEASIRLAVAARAPADARELVMPSVGQWVGALAVDDVRLDAPAILAAYARLLETGQDRVVAPKAVTARKLFHALPAYRNQVMGHGAVKTSEFYDDAGAVLADGIEAVWAVGALWPATSQLVYVETVELDARGARRGRVLDLGGPLSRVDDPRGTALPDDVLPRRVYLRAGERYDSLHPFVLYEEAELRERVLFFNSRRKTAEYLDFVSGERLRGKELAVAFATIETELDARFAGAAPTADAGDAAAAEPRDAARFGDYQLLGKLGEGGMGVVYLARQATFGRLVAVKMLPPSAADNPVTVARFRREIAALGRCDHPNVIKILASGQVDGAHYYTMELVDGADLAGLARALPTTDDFDAAVATASERVRQAKADAYAHVPVLAPRQLAPSAATRPADQLRKLVELFRDAARGVEHLHEMGILHRDLKPANLMVTAGDHRVVVMDLGLAALGDASESLTRDKGSILGTLRYMPPEQLQRNLLQLDRRADIYSLGATFYELLCARPLFDGDSEVRLLEQVLRELPVPPRIANPRLPADLATIVGKAIEKDPRNRYDTAGALAADLEAYLGGRAIAARPPTLGYLVSLAIRKHRAIAATVAVSFVVVAVGVTGFLIRERGLRVDAERASTRARAAETLAQAARQHSDQLVARTYAELGRQELIAHRPGRGAAYLEQAYRALPTEAPIPYLMASALQAVERASVPLVGSIGEVSFSHDGRRVIGISDGGVRIWDAATGAVLSTIPTPDKSRSASFSPSDARIVVLGASGDVRVWADDNKQLVATLSASVLASPLVSATFAPDGNDVLVVTERAALLWNVQSGATRDLLGVDADGKTTVFAAFSARGSYVVVTRSRYVVTRGVSEDVDNEVWIWDARTRTARLALKGGSSVVAFAVFDPSERRLAGATEDGAVRIWDATTATLVRTIATRHKSWPVNVVFSGDGTVLATADLAGEVKIWSVESGTPIAAMQADDDAVRALEVSPTGHRLLSAGDDGDVRIWDLDTGQLEVVLEGGDTWGAASFSPDGAHVVNGGPSARVWDVGSEVVHEQQSGRDDDACRLLATSTATKTVLAWPRRWDSMISLAPSADSKRLAIANDHCAYVWDMTAARGFPLASVAADTAMHVNHVRLSPDSATLVVSSVDDAHRKGASQIWNLASATAALRLEGGAAEFSADGATLLTIDDRLVRLWNPHGLPKLLLSGHEGVVSSAAFSADSRYVVTASADATVRIWDLPSGNVRQILRLPRAVSDAAFSPNGELVATTDAERNVDIWDVRAGQVRFHLGVGSHARFSHDGTRLAMVVDGGSVWVWSTSTGKPLTVIASGGSGVFVLKFSPDDTQVATTATRATRLWDSTTGQLLRVFEDQHEVSTTSFFPDGRHLTSAAQDVTIWDVHAETRAPEEISRIVSTHVPWQVVDGRLVPR